MKSKIRLLIPYYGKWPNYFNLFLEGCRLNSEFDFLLITDLPPPCSCPSNVQFHQLSFEELRSLIGRKIKKKTLLFQPYKLCDFKPMYGVIFSDFLTGYDFWGYGDIDLVYGRLSKFITESLLENHDIISLRKHWLSGCFVLLKNVSRINFLYTESPSWELVAEKNSYMGFDECLGNYFKNLEEGESLFDLDKNDSMSLLVKKNSMAGEIRTYFEDVIAEDLKQEEYIQWAAGAVLGKSGKEYPLFHYVQLKSLDAFFFPILNNVEKKYYITETGLYRVNEFEGKIYFILKIWRKIKGFGRRMARIPARVRKIWNKVFDCTRSATTGQ